MEGKLPKNERKDTARNEKIKNLLEGFDFQIIRDIVGTILEKSGVSKNVAEKISLDLFVLLKSPTFLGRILDKFVEDVAWYNEIGDIVVINNERIFEMDNEKVILIIIHEISHSVSEVFVKYSNGNPYEVRVGLASMKKNEKSKWLTENRLLNEGVTELLAESIEGEYLNRKGESINNINRYSNSYPVAKKVVEILVRSISKKTGVPVDDVFKSVVRSMLNYDYESFYELVKLDDNDEELLQLLDAIKGLDTQDDVASKNIFGKVSYNFDKLTVAGFKEIVDKVINSRDYFNPLMNKVN